MNVKTGANSSRNLDKGVLNMTAAVPSIRYRAFVWHGIAVHAD